MSYEPREGVDFIIDLYALAGAAPDAEPDELKRALNQRLVEYHPDRLEGLAPEFQSKGERMARLLNRAKFVLLDPEKRHSYDEIMAEWEGPVSKDGTPIVSMDRYLQSEMENKTPDEIEDIFAKQAGQIEAMSGYTPSRLDFLENMIAKAGDDVPDDLRAEYENALLSYDYTLAIQEAERSRLLSLPDIAQGGYCAGLDYSEYIAGEIETARVARKEELRMQALGGVGTRLALLAGEEFVASSADVVLVSAMELPAYFDQQAEKIREIVGKRQEVVKKRLANFRPVYPEAELQEGKARPKLAIGIGEEGFKWFSVAFDQVTSLASLQPIPEELTELLDTGDYKAVIERGYNLLTFAPLEQIDIQAQLTDAIEKHVNKFGMGKDNKLDA